MRANEVTDRRCNRHEIRTCHASHARWCGASNGRGSCAALASGIENASTDLRREGRLADLGRELSVQRVRGLQSGNHERGKNCGGWHDAQKRTVVRLGSLAWRGWAGSPLAREPARSRCGPAARVSTAHWLLSQEQRNHETSEYYFGGGSRETANVLRLLELELGVGHPRQLQLWRAAKQPGGWRWSHISTTSARLAPFGGCGTLIGGAGIGKADGSGGSLGASAMASCACEPSCCVVHDSQGAARCGSDRANVCAEYARSPKIFRKTAHF